MIKGDHRSPKISTPSFTAQWNRMSSLDIDFMGDF
jgi:hypothetical protein